MNGMGVLAVYQTEWLNILYSDKPIQKGVVVSFYTAVIRHVLRRPMAALGLVMVPTMALVDTLCAHGGGELRLGVRMLSGTTSSAVALFILKQRKEVVVNALRQVINAANSMESEANAEGKALINAEVRHSRFIFMKCYAAYAAYVCLGCVVGFIHNYDTASSLWLRRESMACSCWWSWSVFTVSWVMRLSGCYGLIGCVTCLFVVLCVELNLHSACGQLLREVGRRLRDAKAGQIGELDIRRHVELLTVCRLVNDMFGLMLPLFLMSSVVVAVISTAILLDKTSYTWDPFTWGTLPQLPAIFVAQCILGQQLQDASSAVSWSAYEGVWLEEPVQHQRHRLLIMTSAARPASFTVAGMGTLNLRTCFQGLSVWFKYLQLLINLNYNQ